MKTRYDLVYLTNTPSFYKLNLCNEIAKTHSLLLVLYGYGSEAVNAELTEYSHYNFDYYFLNEGDSNSRSRLKTFIRLLKLMHSIKYEKVIFAGWFSLEYNLFAFLSPKKKNAMVCESSIFDVSLAGLSGLIKRKIIKRMSCALPSGKPHAQLFDVAGFKGRKYITGSVGIFNKPQRKSKIVHSPLRYIYVGRLVPVKNVELLVEEFNRSRKQLTIVGAGLLEESLKKKAKSNITFTGFINNDKLGDVYQANDVFILPSYYEPWGLVVEEALYWGLPVIVSNRVGSSIDMVKDLKTGVIFDSKDVESLHHAITEMEIHFNEYYDNVRKIDWTQRDKNQVKAYDLIIV